MDVLPIFATGGSHHEVGQSIGERFAAQINAAFDTYPLLTDRMLRFHRTPEGQAVYGKLLEANRERYPDYVAEMEGLAQGADRPFEEVFLVNMRAEYRALAPERLAGCTDISVMTPGTALLGHTEDGSPAFQGQTYLVTVTVSGKPAFTAFSYPGFLCSNAFGFNAEGIFYSINNVDPLGGRIGLGRHLVARSVLEARTLDDAIRRATPPGRATGFNYNIGSLAERRVVHLEVSPESHSLREAEGTYAHTNHYSEIPGIAQDIGPSSEARLQRATALLRQAQLRDATGLLALLGDEDGDGYPIHRTATAPDTSTTLCTALFDLDVRHLRIYAGHPVRERDDYVEFSM